MHENKLTIYAPQRWVHHPLILLFFRMYSQRKKHIYLDVKRLYTIANNLQAILKGIQICAGSVLLHIPPPSM